MSNSTTLSAAAAARLLGHNSTAQVLTLVRNDRLELTVESVVAYRDSRGRKGAKSGVKTFHVKCTPEQADEIRETFGVEVVNPHDLTKAREANRLAEAQSELDELREQGLL